MTAERFTKTALKNGAAVPMFTNEVQYQHLEERFKNLIIDLRPHGVVQYLLPTGGWCLAKVSAPIHNRGLYRITHSTGKELIALLHTSAVTLPTLSQGICNQEAIHRGNRRSYTVINTEVLNCTIGAVDKEMFAYVNPEGQMCVMEVCEFGRKFGQRGETEND